MKYEGKIYGKVGGKYIEIDDSVSDLKTLLECPKEIINDHWNYVQNTLMYHGIKDDIILRIARYHYKTAFAHGWKHAIEKVLETAKVRR